jgi:hypothetical protein
MFLLLGLILGLPFFVPSFALPNSPTKPNSHSPDHDTNYEDEDDETSPLPPPPPPPSEQQQEEEEDRRLVGPTARLIVRLLQREPTQRLGSAAAADAIQGIRRRYLEVRASVVA